MNWLVSKASSLVEEGSKFLDGLDENMREDEAGTRNELERKRTSSTSRSPSSSTGVERHQRRGTPPPGVIHPQKIDRTSPRSSRSNKQAEEDPSSGQVGDRDNPLREAFEALHQEMEKLNQGDKQGLEEEMRPQLERLVNVLKDVQGQMKAKDKEMEHLRTQLEEEKRGGQADTQWLLEEKQEELLMLREKAEEMKAQLQAFRAQLDEQETQAQAWIMEKTALVARMSKLEEKEMLVADLQDQVKNRERALDKLTKQAQADETELKAQIQQLKEALESGSDRGPQQRLEDYEQSLEMLKQDKAIAQLQDQVKSREEAMDRLTREKQGEEAELRAIIQQLQVAASGSDHALEQRLEEQERLVEDLKKDRDSKLEEKEAALAQLRELLKSKEMALEQRVEEQERLVKDLKKDKDSKLEEKEAALAQLREHLKSKEKALETAIRAKEAEEAEWKAEIEQLKEAVKGSDQALNERLQEQEQLIEKLSQDKVSMESHLRSEVAALQEQMGKRDGLLQELETAASENDKRLQERIDGLQQEKQRLIDDLAVAREEADKLVVDREKETLQWKKEMEETQAALQSQVAESTKHVVELEATLAAKMETLAAYEEQLRGAQNGAEEVLKLRQRLEEMTIEGDKLQARIKNFEAATDAQQLEIHRLVDHVQVLEGEKKEADRLTEQLHNLQTLMLQKEGEMSRLQSQMEEKVESLATAHEQIQLAENKVKDLMGRVKELQAGQEEMESMRSHVAVLEGRLREAEESHKEGRGEVEQRISDANRTIEELQEQQGHLKDALRQSETRASESKKELEASEKALTHAKEEVAKMGSSLHAAREDKEREVQRLREELVDLMKGMDESRAMEASLKSQLDEAHTELASVKESVEQSVKKAADEARVQLASEMEQELGQFQADLEKQREHWVMQLKEMTDAKEAAEAAVAASNQEVGRWKAAEGKLQQELLHKDQELETTKYRVRELEEQRRQSSATTDFRITEMASKHESEVKSLTSQLQTFRRQQAEERSAHEAEIFRLRQEMGAAEEKVKGFDEVAEELERLRLKKKKDLEECRRLNQHISSLQLSHLEALATLRGEKEALRLELEEVKRQQEASKELESYIVVGQGSEGGGGGVTAASQDISAATLAVAHEEQEQVRQLQEEVATSREEVTRVRQAMEAIEARLMVESGEVQKWKAQAEQTASEMGKRVHGAESLRDTLKKEVAYLKAELNAVRQQQLAAAATQQQSGIGASTASVYQRAGRQPASASWRTSDPDDLEAQQDSLDSSGSKKPLLSHMHIIPGFEVCIMQTRRRFPIQAAWFEQKVLPRITPKCLTLSYIAILHLFVIFSLTRTLPPA